VGEDAGCFPLAVAFCGSAVAIVRLVITGGLVAEDEADNVVGMAFVKFFLNRRRYAVERRGDDIAQIERFFLGCEPSAGKGPDFRHKYTPRSVAGYCPSARIGRAGPGKISPSSRGAKGA